MSHLALFEVPTYHKIIGVTDGGMIIAPDLEQKVQIIENAVSFFDAFALRANQGCCSLR